MIPDCGTGRGADEVFVLIGWFRNRSWAIREASERSAKTPRKVVKNGKGVVAKKK